MTPRTDLTPYDSGWNAALRGEPESANPYYPNEEEFYGRWRFGWLNASAGLEAERMGGRG